jgi:nicotinate-nucleotide adenylyltransferase
MLRLALQGEPRCRIDERELQPGATGYTVDTLRALHAEQPRDELYLLIGSDQLAKFGSWHQPDEIKRLAKLAVFRRPEFRADTAGVPVIAMAPLAISASAIRRRVAHGEDLADCVPASVAGYILRHGLYR